MDYRMLGGSGCAVSSLCLGTMTFGAETDEAGAHQQLDRFIDAVQKVAEERGVSMAEVALAWVTDRPAVSSTILGTRTMSQLETNLRAARLHLSAAETAALDAASDPHAPDYPYGELGVEQRARTLPGGR
jgi:aryl-alcohol dehydrogenase-like predicted oxidoreductase